MTAPEKLQIRTPDGVADAWAYRPEGAAPAPAVLFYPDAGGIRPSMHQMAGRVAELGYFVLLPNVYYRAGDFAPFDLKTVFTDPEERARIMSLVKSLEGDVSVRDAGAYLDAIAAHAGARPGKVGVMGYCMGGKLAFTIAGTHPDRIAAAASIHGGYIATGEPDSPHRSADKIKAELYFGVADEDGSCTPEHQGILASALGAARVAYQIELYRGARHGFAVPDLPMYDEAAAERHWARLAALFASALPRD
jgi:carboxymethylenebutenolidase